MSMKIISTLKNVLSLWLVAIVVIRSSMRINPVDYKIYIKTKYEQGNLSCLWTKVFGRLSFVFWQKM